MRNEAAFRELVSGERPGLCATLARSALLALSIPYGCAVRFRNFVFDRGWKRSRSAGVPVISVGNITTGGTGKTPLVAFLANWFSDQQIRAAILSRGYRAIDEAANDEKLLLDRQCPGVPHYQHPRRVVSARRAVQENGAQLLILDDGFQHRYLERDLNIVLIDALNPFGYGYLLPRGLLREPLSSLRRADIVVVTRVDQCPPEERDRILSRIHQFRPDIECVEVAYPPTQLVNESEESIPLSSLEGRRIGAFCGIGNPPAFRKSLTDLGMIIRSNDFMAFPDHHHYSEAELQQLGQTYRSRECVAILTTEKDFVKIRRDTLDGLPLWAVRIGVEFHAGQELLESRLRALLPSS